MAENIEKKVDESWKDKAKTETHEKTEPAGEAQQPDFKFFLSSLAMQAWIGLGAIQNPITQKTEQNLGQAKFIIDTLDIVKVKTKGNLDKEEDELLEHILYELHMFYAKMSLENKPKA